MFYISPFSCLFPPWLAWTSVQKRGKLKKKSTKHTTVLKLHSNNNSTSTRIKLRRNFPEKVHAKRVLCQVICFSSARHLHLLQSKFGSRAHVPVFRQNHLKKT